MGHVWLCAHAYAIEVTLFAWRASALPVGVVLGTSVACLTRIRMYFPSQYRVPSLGVSKRGARGKRETANTTARTRRRKSKSRRESARGRDTSRTAVSRDSQRANALGHDTGHLYEATHRG